MRRLYIISLMLTFALPYPTALAQGGPPDWLSNIRDEALRSCLQDTIDASDQSALQVERVKCHSKGITDVTGLEQLKNLTYLSLFNNKIAEADFSAFRALAFLNIAKNRLEKLNVSGLANLHTLYAFQNDLATIDLSGLHALTKLRLMQNRLTDLDIGELTVLESANLFNNQLEHLSIEGLDKLTFLDVKQNPMPDELYDFFDEQEGIVISHDGNADDWK